MRKRINFSLVFIIIITFFGLVLRLVYIQNHPPLNIDEYSVAYNAYSIAHSGIDEWGVRFPLFFKSFGDYKLPFDIYLLALLFKLFGVNPFLIRLPSVLFGTLYIPFMYIFLKLITKNKLLIYLGTYLMALSQYGVYFSRIISASISQSFLTFLSILLFILFLKKQKTKFLICSVLSLGISLYAYISAWIVAPILCLSFFLILLYKKKYQLSICLLLFVAFFIPVINQYFRGGSKVRFANVSYKGLTLEVNEFRYHSRNDLLSRLLHNKPVYYFYTFANDYIKHFDINVMAYGRSILTQDDTSFPILYLVTVPFYYLGLAYLFKKFKDPVYFVIIVWILISPIPSAITEGGMNSKRFLSFFGSEIILVILGLEAVKFNLKNILSYIFIFLIIAQSIYFIYYYFIPYRATVYANLFFKANKLADMIKQKYYRYDIFAYTTESLGEPQIYPLFATLMPPEKYVYEKRYLCQPWCYIKPFDKFYYADDLNKIIKKVSDNIAGIKIAGYFSNLELIDLQKYCKFKTLKIDPDTEISPKQFYYQIEFVTCHIF